MTVRNEIDVELWEVIQKNYESENYTGAILDAIFKLTDTIRNKTGLEGDGASLIGQAFGGDDPRIKLNAVSYIETYFWSKICHANKPNITWPLERYFKNGLKNKNQKIVQKLETQIIWEEDHPWWDVFKEELNL